MVDSGGRTVGVESDPVAIVIVVEVSKGTSTDEVAGGVPELAGVEERGWDWFGGFGVAIGVRDSATVGLRLVTEDVHDVDTATIDPVSSPSPPAALGSGSHPACTLGHNVATASPEKNIPINVLGRAMVPLQALLMMMVSFSRNSMQPEEQALPLIKSVATQPVRGVL